MGMMLRRYHNRYEVSDEKVTDTFFEKDRTEELSDKTFSESEYTKTEINRMSKEELVTLAIAQRIENAQELSGTEIKRILIDKFGL